jgi:cytidine deaminase
VTTLRESLLAAARAAAAGAYAPYSNFPVGAALLFGDGTVVTGANVENASFGLSLCAETVAAAKAMSDGQYGGQRAGQHGGTRCGLVAVAVSGPSGTITPCGRCRQVLSELAQLGDTDPEVWCGEEGPGMRLSELLPHAFGPANLR